MPWDAPQWEYLYGRSDTPPKPEEREWNGRFRFAVPMAEVFQEMSGYTRTELGKLAEEGRAKGVKVRDEVAQGKPAAEIARARGKRWST